VSKCHFVRTFEATYGETPIRYLTRRRIEPAQDLLRSANLTVTEVCMAVGFASLGSFSSRFTRLLGESPTPTATAGRREHSRATWEKPRGAVGGWRFGMITNISPVTVYCLDQDETRDF
jgi:AraC-like DNA-binding protein